MIIVAAIIRGDKIHATLQFARVLTVAAIPAAMSTGLSVTMAVGARLLDRKKAIVSKLTAIEELAGVDVLCSDKTGTLTQNKLTLGDPFCVNNRNADQVIFDGALTSCAENNDAINSRHSMRCASAPRQSSRAPTGRSSRPQKAPPR